MDRQQLLEKKRQRLLELKSRRSAAPAVEESADMSEHTPQPTRVDFSVQVDLPPAPVSKAAPPRFVSPPAHGSHKIHKAIQTDAIDVEVSQAPIEAPVAVQEPASPPPESIPKEQVIHEALQQRLSAFGYSDLRLGIKHISQRTSDSKTPFDISVNISKFIDRPISCIATTPHHPDLLLVAYGMWRDTPKSRAPKNLAESSDGLAVLFNRSSDAVTPEFFLQCTSAISKIAFDNSDPFRIVAGLESGRLVMWDLTAVDPTQVAVLPTLQTSYISSLTTRTQLRFVHHVSPIVFMKQLNIDSLQDSAIITICEDGVINVWSPNFFALPKFSSIELSPKDTHMLLISDGYLSSHKPYVSQDSHHEAPEYRFLNSVFMASMNGSIYKLANQKESHYVDAELADRIEGAVHNSSVTSLSELSNSLILSAHSDFFLRIWHSEKKKLMLAIPTETLVTSVLGRPNHPNQVVTLGTLRLPDPGFYVELWDLEVSIKEPVFVIPTRKSSTGMAAFSQDGNELMLGYEDGDVDVCRIDDSLLSKHVSASFPTPQGIESITSTSVRA